MTERKPPGMPWEHWMERQIREAEKRGDFENLPGAGKPIPDLRKPHDELWWVKKLMAREKLDVKGGTLELRKELEEAIERIRAQTSEAGVRRIVKRINERITSVNAQATSGPPSDIAPMDPDRVVEQWRARR
jgi:hypothetical protein